MFSDKNVMMCSNSSGLFLVDKAKLHGSCKQKRSMIFQPVSLSRYMRFVCLIAKKITYGLSLKLRMLKMYIYYEKKASLFLSIFYS